MIAQKQTKEELQKMIDWCCENYDSYAKICRLQAFTGRKLMHYPS